MARRIRILAADHDPEVRRHLPLLVGGRFASNLLLRFPAPFLGVIAAGFGTSVGTMGLALSAGEFAGENSTIVRSSLGNPTNPTREP